MPGKTPRPDPTVGQTSLSGIKPMKTKAEIRKERERAKREALKAEREAGVQAEPQGQTRERADWLEEQAESLRNQLMLIERELAQKQKSADELGAIYDEAYRAKNNGTAAKAQSDWTDACFSTEECRKKAEAKKNELTPKIDALELEAFEILESLEA